MDREVDAGIELKVFGAAAIGKGWLFVATDSENLIDPWLLELNGLTKE